MNYFQYFAYLFGFFPVPARGRGTPSRWEVSSSFRPPQVSPPRDWTPKVGVGELRLGSIHVLRTISQRTAAAGGHLAALAKAAVQAQATLPAKSLEALGWPSPPAAAQEGPFYQPGSPFLRVRSRQLSLRPLRGRRDLKAWTSFPVNIFVCLVTAECVTEGRGSHPIHPPESLAHPCSHMHLMIPGHISIPVRKSPTRELSPAWRNWHLVSV